jgi:hypothetical protein
MQILKGKQKRARRVLIYGENGVGKSTFACRFPGPVVMNFEDGISNIDVDHTPRLNSSSDAMGCLVELSSSQEYQTIVIDTLDWLERILMAEVAQKFGKATYGDIGFGKGHVVVEKEWVDLLHWFTQCWNSGKNIVFTAHAQVTKFKNPEGDSYDFWEPAVDSKCSGLISEWCDDVLFATQKVMTIQKDEGFDKKRSVAMSDGTGRILKTTESPSHVAKNRLGMPPEIPLSYFEYEKFLNVSPAKQSGNVAGLVVDGSSKVGVN